MEVSRTRCVVGWVWVLAGRCSCGWCCGGVLSAGRAGAAAVVRACGVGACTDDDDMARDSEQGWWGRGTNMGTLHQNGAAGPVRRHVKRGRGAESPAEARNGWRLLCALSASTTIDCDGTWRASVAEAAGVVGSRHQGAPARLALWKTFPDLHRLARLGGLGQCLLARCAQCRLTASLGVESTQTQCTCITRQQQHSHRRRNS